MNAEKTLDVCGDSCPSYAIKCRVALEKMKIGEVLRIIASERACLSVIPRLAKRNSCEITEQSQSSKEGFSFLINKIGRIFS